MAKKRNRQRGYTTGRKTAKMELKAIARQMNIRIIESTGVNSKTLAEAVQLLEEADIFMPLDFEFVCFSSADEIGLYLALTRTS